MKLIRKFIAIFLVPVPNENEFAVFAHVKDKIYTNFNEIRCEIEAETDRLGGKKVEFVFFKLIKTLLSFFLIRIFTKNQLP